MPQRSDFEIYSELGQTLVGAPSVALFPLFIGDRPLRAGHLRMAPCVWADGRSAVRPYRGTMFAEASDFVPTQIRSS